MDGRPRTNWLVAIVTEFRHGTPSQQLAILADAAALIGVSLLAVLANMFAGDGNWQTRAASVSFALMFLAIGWLVFIIVWGVISYVRVFFSGYPKAERLVVWPLYMIWILFSLTFFFATGIQELRTILTGEMFR